MTRIPCALLFCAGLAGASERAVALEASEVLLFSWGRLTIKPQLAVSETYNDNIFARASDETADFTTTVSPGVTFLLGQRTANHIILNYTLNQHFYADRTDLNATEHLFELRSFIDRGRWNLQGNDRIQFLDSPIGDVQVLEGSIDQPLILTEDKVSRNTYINDYRLSYEISPKTVLYVQGQHIGYDYEERIRLYDQTTLIGTGGFAYQALSKTVLFGEGFYGITTSEPNVTALETPDMIFAGGALGARGDFTPKLSGTVRIGYETREFEGQDASNDPVVAVGLNYRFSTRTDVALGFQRRQDVSIQFDEQTYTAQIVNAQLTQTIGSRGKLRATLGGYYGFYNYDQSQFSPARDYDVYSINFGVAYQIQLWLSASLNFDRTGVIGSARDVTEYDVNRLTFRLAIGY